MTDAPKREFGKRRQVSVPPSPMLPPKRSNHVALLVMGTVAVGSAAYALMPRECAPAQPGTPGAPVTTCPQRSSSSGSGGGWRYSYYWGGSSASSPAATSESKASTVRRGGFGAVAHSFSSHFSFGS